MNIAAELVVPGTGRRSQAGLICTPRRPSVIRRFHFGRPGRTDIRSSRERVLVDQPAEAIAPSDPGDGRWYSRHGHYVDAIRRREVQGAVRPMSVVMINEGPQDPLEVATVGDQQPIQALSPHGPDEALGDRVRLRRFDRGADDPDPLAAKDLIESTVELGVVVADQEARWSPTVRELPDEVPRLLCDPGAVEVLGHTGDVDPTGRDLDEEEDIDAP